MYVINNYCGKIGEFIAYDQAAVTEHRYVAVWNGRR
jgi:hypothetical protein